jgi:hypothetical protein
MKTFCAILGVLTLAQWVFIGLLHGFLTLQHKRSPETMSKLHDIPVVGGYFMPLKTESDAEKLNVEQAERNLRLIEAKEILALPAAFSPDDLRQLTEDIKARKAQLFETRQDFEERETRLADLRQEIERREKTVASRQEELEKKAQEMGRQQIELQSQLKVRDVEKSDAEATVLKKLAKIYAEIDPQKAAQLLITPAELEGDEKETVDATALRAAKVLVYMDAEKSARVLEIMDAVEAVRVGEKLKQLAGAK